MDTTTILTELEAFVRKAGQVLDDDPDFAVTTDLWENGYLDSNGVVEVLAFIEERFGVTVPEEALFLAEFTRLEGMARIVAGLAPGASHPG